MFDTPVKSSICQKKKKSLHRLRFRLFNFSLSFVIFVRFSPSKIVHQDFTLSRMPRAHLQTCTHSKYNDTCNNSKDCFTYSVSAEQVKFQPLNTTRPVKSLWDECDQSIVYLLQIWWLHTMAWHNGKWHSRVQIISCMNAFFRSHYLNVLTQQTYPTTNEGIWRRRGKKVPFTELAW